MVYGKYTIMSNIVTIFGKYDCGFCEKAKELCEDYRLPYEYKDIAEFQNLEEMMGLFPKTKTVPQIMWNSRKIGSYTEFATEIENTIGGYGENVI
jgi:glutaredoxin 1